MEPAHYFNFTTHHNLTRFLGPDDNALKTSLLRYARERLTAEQRIRRLAKEHKFYIGKTKLKELNKEFAIPTVRKPPPLPVATTRVCQKMEEDRHGANGPNTVQTLLALEDCLIPRSVVQAVMKANNGEGSDRRMPGNADKIKRSNLTSLGIFHELNCDGHEKLASSALQMGEVGPPIYLMRDKASGAIALLCTILNARYSIAIGHIYLDLTTEHGAIPLQITVDKGSETGDMYADHISLRQNYVPELDLDQWPAFVALKSTNNVVAEACWKWLRKTCGHNIKDYILEGKMKGFFNPMNELHVNLFNWLWSQIVQLELDKFTAYWNSHKIRRQDRKNMPSGATPMDIFTCPESYGLEWLSVLIPQEAIDALRAQKEVTREEAFRWVDDEFKAAAEDVYAEIGSPTLSCPTGWRIFNDMVPQLARM